LHRRKIKKKALRLLASKLSDNKYDEESLGSELFTIAKECNISPQDFFKASYIALINNQKGPRLAPFILTVGKNKVIKLLTNI